MKWSSQQWPLASVSSRTPEARRCPGSDAVAALNDVLELRSNTRSRTVARKDIEGFRWATRPLAASHRSGIHVLLRDETVLSLDVRNTTLPRGRGRERLDLRSGEWQEGETAP